MTTNLHLLQSKPPTAALPIAPTLKKLQSLPNVASMVSTGVSIGTGIDRVPTRSLRELMRTHVSFSGVGQHANGSVS